MATRAFSRLKTPICTSILIRNLTRTSIIHHSLPLKPKVPALEPDYCNPICYGVKLYHDGRPRGPLWRGKKLIGKEALFVILGLKRFKDDEEKLEKFIKTHVLRLLKMDLIAVLSELERQEEVALAVKVSNFRFHCTFCYTFSFGLLLEFQFLGLCLVTLSLTIEIVILLIFWMGNLLRIIWKQVIFFFFCEKYIRKSIKWGCPGSVW